MVAASQPSADPLEPSEEAQSLITAARYGDVEDVTLALEDGVSADAVDTHGCTGLHMASANGHTDIVHLLLEHSADATVGNSEGNTPLHWACLNGHEDVIRALLAADAAPSALNMHDRTPIDEVLNRSEPLRQRLLDLVDAHMKSGNDDSSGGGSDGDSMQLDTGEANGSGGKDFTFVQKPPPISSRPAV